MPQPILPSIASSRQLHNLDYCLSSPGPKSVRNDFFQKQREYIVSFVILKCIDQDTPTGKKTKVVTRTTQNPIEPQTNSSPLIAPLAANPCVNMNMNPSRQAEPHIPSRFVFVPLVQTLVQETPSPNHEAQE
ncbi:MAG: hypothetical protein Ct9H300mP28_30940 [Pseudomonadota bacterium]|nr:MAG: hypothetical protein Ct9H300mP28_30940 [Pseudomonadota bacterium]